METEIYNITNKQSSILYYFMLTIGIIGSLLIISLNLFRMSIVEIITPFFEPIIEVIVYSFYGICSIVVLLYFLFSKSKKRTRNVTPLIIVLTTLIIVCFLPFTALTINLDYELNKSERDKVVSLILQGELSPNVSHNSELIHLSEEFEHLSRGGGEVVVKDSGQDKYILFFTYRGVVDNYAGFLYTTNEKAPDETLFSKLIEIKQFDKNWYWINAT